jgi:hypothetical protein
VLLMAGPAVVARRVRAWDAPAIAVDEPTALRLASRTVTLHVPLMHEAALQCAMLEDLPRPEPRAGSGWMCRARQSGRLVEAAVTAALHGERDGLDDPVVSLALGRPPGALDEGRVEHWAAQEVERRGRIWERVGARSGDAEDAEQGQHRNPYLDRSLDELELSVATSNALAEGGVRTIGELCRRTETEVLKLRNIGRKGLREIKEILSALGLSLGMRGV